MITTTIPEPTETNHNDRSCDGGPTAGSVTLSEEPFLPPPPSWLVNLYNDAASETADVWFVVGEATYGAHKHILFIAWKKLYEIAAGFGSNNNNNNTAPVVVPIVDVRPQVFKILLDSAYNITKASYDEELAREIVDASDRYGVEFLKNRVEAVLVQKFLTPRNAAALFILADARSCGMLKLSAMCEIWSHPAEAKRTRAWSAIEASDRLRTEVFRITTNPGKARQLLNQRRRKHAKGRSSSSLGVRVAAAATAAAASASRWKYDGRQGETTVDSILLRRGCQQ